MGKVRDASKERYWRELIGRQHERGETVARFCAREGVSVDRRADIYAAGVVLWEALTGRRLFSGDSSAVFARILTERVPLVSEILPELKPYDDVVARGLDRDIRRRYATAREMLIRRT